jgi:ABC-2 type transport system ATP-binding protein
MSVLEIKNITKEYGATRALDDVTLRIDENKIYGLLGRNGAGKTTLLKVMTGKIFPTAGEITLDGQSVYENHKALNRIFYMMEKNLYPEGERVKSIFKWTKLYYPAFDMAYALALAERFGLNIHKKIKSLSTGYSSIFKGIVALASNAEILLLDEPVLGLDANHRSMLYKELIASYNERPKTIIISTHLIEEVEAVLEEVIIIKEGRLIEKKSVEQLLQDAYTVSGDAGKVEEFLKGKKSVQEESLGRYKAATVFGRVGEEERALAGRLELEIAGAELQKLFISLTNS